MQLKDRKDGCKVEVQVGDFKCSQTDDFFLSQAFKVTLKPSVGKLNELLTLKLNQFLQSDDPETYQLIKDLFLNIHDVKDTYGTLINNSERQLNHL